MMLNNEDTIAKNPSFIKFLYNHFNWKGIILYIHTTTGININLLFVLHKNTWICVPFSSALNLSLEQITPYISHILNNITISDLHQGEKTVDLNKIIPFNQKAVHWEIRSVEKISAYYYDKKIISLLSLENSEKLQFQKLSPNIRRKIRKAKRNNISIVSSNLLPFPTKNSTNFNGINYLVDDFYKVFSRNMKYLGSPALEKKFFKNLLKYYQNGLVNCFVAYYKNKPIGGAISLSYEGYFENSWFSTLRKYNRLYPSYFLHWTMIQNAIHHKMKIYSFGRSTKNSGVHQYKKQWGTYDQQIYWNYSHPKKWNIRDLYWIKHLWKLLPLFIANWIGPWIAKRIY